MLTIFNNKVFRGGPEGLRLLSLVEQADCEHDKTGAADETCDNSEIDPAAVLVGAISDLFDMLSVVLLLQFFAQALVLCNSLGLALLI